MEAIAKMEERNATTGEPAIGDAEEACRADRKDGYAGQSPDEGCLNFGIRTRCLKLVEDHLARRGFEILERDWSCKAGTVDFIADDGGEIAFVTMRVRNGRENGAMDASLEEVDRITLERIAVAYLAGYEGECRVRFDVVSMLLIGSDHVWLRYIEDAFEV